MKRVKRQDRILTVTFRPDSRNGYKDFQIPKELAEKLFKAGEIAGDGTNGGYMPFPDQTEYGVKGWRNKVRVHFVTDDLAEPTTRRG